MSSKNVGCKQKFSCFFESNTCRQHILGNILCNRISGNRGGNTSTWSSNKHRLTQIQLLATQLLVPKSQTIHTPTSTVARQVRKDDTKVIICAFMNNGMFGDSHRWRWSLGVF